VGFSVLGSTIPTEDHDTTETTTERKFKLVGDVWPLATLAKAEDAHKPGRPFGGWLCTYGKVGPDGGIVPTVDRDGHTFEAAKQLGYIDWDTYMKKGVWNDTHSSVVVGLPDTLEFHDGTTELSKGHGKVGFWTTGHLFDRAEPKSWVGLVDKAGQPRRPTETEFARADYFWDLAHLLKGTPRPLGLSADGVMAMSACRKRVLWARMDAAAICETPVNPDATVEPMIYAVLGRALVGETGDPSPCGKCSCPPGGCQVLRKSSVGKVQGPGNGTAGGSVIPQYADAGKIQRSLGSPVEALIRGGDELRERVLQLLQEEYLLARPDAEEWLRDYLRRVAQPPQTQTGERQ
jgi:hypothetical protein